MRLAVLLFFIAAAGLAGCSGNAPATLETSSSEALAKSVAAMAEGLPEADRKRLGPALLKLAMAGAVEDGGSLLALAAAGSDPNFMLTQLSAYSGKSGKELLALADALKPGTQAGVEQTSSAQADYCNGNVALLNVEAWTVSPSEDSAAGYKTNLLELTIRNTGAKAIRMVDGSFGFIDALGEEIARAAIDRDVSLAAGASFTQTGRWGPNTFERLLGLRKDEVKSFACVRSVLYEDGTKDEF